jgi:hypothetical protein
MRMPFSSIEICTLPPGASGGAGGLGALATTGARSTTVSLTVQLKGGSWLRMPAITSSRIDSSVKRTQLRPTSQLA